MLALSLALALAPASGPADPADEMVEIKQGTPVSIRKDRAYLIVRVHTPAGVPRFEPVFLRVPTEAEMQEYSAARAAAYAEAAPKLIKIRQDALARNARAEAEGRKYRIAVPPVPSLETFDFVYRGLQNLNAVSAGRPFQKGDPDTLFLVETLPGDFVLYGVSYAAGYAALSTCFCLGTVGFTAKAGEVTDLGTFIADGAKFKSRIPELAAETGFGPSTDTPMILVAGTVRPAATGGQVPQALAGVTIKPADYRAVGKYFNPNNAGVNRLVAVPGVLAYDGGKVIDVKTGREARGAYPFD